MLRRSHFLRNRSDVPMDPLSDVLSLVKPRNYRCGGFDAGGDVCIRLPEHEGIFCYAVVSGEVWLSVEGGPERVRLTTSDCVVVPPGRSFHIGTDLDLPPVDVDALLRNRPDGGITAYRGGGRCLVVGGHFILDGTHAELLLGILPPLVHINADEDRAALRWLLDRMMIELRDPQPGGFLVREHLAHLMLVQALRLHLASGGAGWLSALGNKKMSAVITAMHKEPARRWTLEALAELSGMSRTTLAVRFKEAVGMPPMEYLRRWRMLLAGSSLTTADQSVSTIAPMLGYESDSAFSTAFKKVMGVSPRQYSRREQAANRP